MILDFTMCLQLNESIQGLTYISEWRVKELDRIAPSELIRPLKADLFEATHSQKKTDRHKSFEQSHSVLDLFLNQ